ncbi:MAG: hypothetical protein AAFR17_00300 [Pseudomonadota bacterium]
MTKRGLPVLTAIPILGGLIETGLLYLTALRWAFRPHAGAGPFIARPDLLPFSLRLFGAGLTFYALITGAAGVLLQTPDLIEALQGPRRPGPFEIAASFLLHYGFFAMVLYYLLSLAMWRILDPTAAFALVFLGAGFLLPLRGIEGAAQLWLLSELWPEGGADLDFRAGGAVQTLFRMQILIAILAALPGMMIGYTLFYQWMRAHYSVHGLLMLGALVLAAGLSVLAPLWLYHATLRLPDRLFDLLDLLT